MYRNGNPRKEDQTGTPTNYPQKVFKPKQCKLCTASFEPNAPSERYCSDPCKDQAYNDRYLLSKYNMTLENYNKILIDQGCVCKICKLEGWVMAEHHKLKLVVDHDHTTGAVRGLLCHNCNRGLGLFQDNKDNLLKAATYLERCNDYPIWE